MRMNGERSRGVETETETEREWIYAEFVWVGNDDWSSLGERLRDVEGFAPRGTIRGRSDSGARNSPLFADVRTPPTAPKKIPTIAPGFECCFLDLKCFAWATGFLVREWVSEGIEIDGYVDTGKPIPIFFHVVATNEFIVRVVAIPIR